MTSSDRALVIMVCTTADAFAMPQARNSFAIDETCEHGHHACRRCGSATMKLVPAPPSTVHQELGRIIEAETRRALGLPPAKPIQAWRGSETRWFATQAEADAWLEGAGAAGEALAPGWARDPGRVNETYRHASGASVWCVSGVWSFDTERCRGVAGLNDRAPTRDEAMARALGFAPKESGDWYGGEDDELCASKDDDCTTWTAFDDSRSLTGFNCASLPAAIAFARGDA